MVAGNRVPMRESRSTVAGKTGSYKFRAGKEKAPPTRGGAAGPGNGNLGRGSVPVDLLQGKGEIRDRRCTCRELYDHCAH